MSEIIEKLTPILEPIVKEHNLVIDSLDYIRKGKEYFLQLYVEREDLSPVDLDEIVSLSDDVSSKLDEVDLISDNYTLDVSTSGAEKPIKDFKKFPILVGKFMEIRVNNPIKGENVFRGILEETSEDKITISYKVKTRTLKVEIALDNITKANLAVQI